MAEYDVMMHFGTYWDTYSVNASGADNARYTAVKRVICECGREEADTIDVIRVYRGGTDRLLTVAWCDEQIDEIKDEIKAYMDRNKTSELNVDVFTVHYTETTTERFDSKALRESDEEIYKKYLKSGTSKRFSIT